MSEHIGTHEAGEGHGQDPFPGTEPLSHQEPEPHHHPAEHEVGDAAVPPRPRRGLLNLKRETRAGIAILFSFLVLTAVLIGKKRSHTGAEPKNKGTSAQASGTRPGEGARTAGTKVASQPPPVTSIPPRATTTPASPQPTAVAQQDEPDPLDSVPPKVEETPPPLVGDPSAPAVKSPTDDVSLTANASPPPSLGGDIPAASGQDTASQGKPVAEAPPPLLEVSSAAEPPRTEPVSPEKATPPADLAPQEALPAPTTAAAPETPPATTPANSTAPSPVVQATDPQPNPSSAAAPGTPPAAAPGPPVAPTPVVQEPGAQAPGEDLTGRVPDGVEDGHLATKQDTPQPASQFAPVAASPAPRPSDPQTATATASEPPPPSALPDNFPPPETTASAGTGTFVIPKPRARGRRTSGREGVGAVAINTTPTRPASVRNEVAEPDAIEPILHTVRSGENFWTISRFYYSSGRYYKALWAANKDLVTAPDQLRTNQTIRIPPPEALDRALILPPSPSQADPLASAPEAADGAAAKPARKPGGIELAPSDRPRRPKRRRERLADDGYPQYQVRKHDTLRSIARDTLGDPHREVEIFDMNRDAITDPHRLAPGQVLLLPEDARVSVSRPTQLR